MRIDRGRLGWGVFFLTLGLVPLSIRLGWVDAAWFEGIWRLWPLILVGIGVGLILRRTAFAAIGNVIVGLTFGLIIGGALATPINAGLSCIPTGGTGEGATTQSGTFTGSTAEVRLAFPCADVVIGAIAGTDWTVATTGVGADEIDISADPASLEVDRSGGAAIWNQGKDAKLRVELPTAPEMGLEIDASAGSVAADLGAVRLSELSMSVNAAKATARLAEAVIGSLSITVNAGSADISLPGSPFDGSASVNAGSLSLCVPEGTALRVTSSSALGSVEFGPGFTREGDAWVTSAWTSAGSGSEMRLSVNLGSAEIRSGGCQ
ncbi:MAG TPA: hypothetical protein VMT36_05225 [Candidatus Saccharimonadia bacterium]|nr:hypothetical protein [Candidatus Saccharimonadia bacterium]